MKYRRIDFVWFAFLIWLATMLSVVVLTFLSPYFPTEGHWECQEWEGERLLIGCGEGDIGYDDYGWYYETEIPYSDFEQYRDNCPKFKVLGHLGKTCLKEVWTK